MYELLHDLPNDFKIRILGNQGISRKSMKGLDFMENTQPAT